jgi:hypothetical protein
MDGADVRVREKIRRQWVSFVAFGVALMTLGFVALGAIGFVARSSRHLRLVRRTIAD